MVSPLNLLAIRNGLDFGVLGSWGLGFKVSFSKGSRHPGTRGILIWPGSCCLVYVVHCIYFCICILRNTLSIFLSSIYLSIYLTKNLFTSILYTVPMSIYFLLHIYRFFPSGSAAFGVWKVATMAKIKLPRAIIIASRESRSFWKRFQAPDNFRSKVVFWFDA